MNEKLFGRWARHGEESHPRRKTKGHRRTAKAFGRSSLLKQVFPCLGSFVLIRGYSWFAVMNNRILPLERSTQQGRTPRTTNHHQLFTIHCPPLSNPNSSFITHHSSFLIHHSSFIIRLSTTSRIPCREASRPVQRKHCLAACPTNISRPLTTLARFPASRRSRVSKGL